VWGNPKGVLINKKSIKKQKKQRGWGREKYKKKMGGSKNGLKKKENGESK